MSLSRSFLAVLLLTPLLPSQTGLLKLTTSNRPHLDAVVSPGGTHVAFRTGPTELGIVDIQAGTESIVYQSGGTTISSFVWSPIGQGLYFAEGNDVRFVGRTGGTPLLLGTVPGSHVTVTSVDEAETLVYGTRFDGTNSYLYSLAANGGGSPSDLHSAVGRFSGARLDPSDSALVFERSSGIPFTPVDYQRVDVTGANPATLFTTSGNGISLNDQYWVDAGQTAVFTGESFDIVTASVGGGGNATYYTQNLGAHRRVYVEKLGDWIACEVTNPDGNGVSPAVVPTDGGGVVPLTPGQQLRINGLGNLLGGLSIDRGGNAVVLGASTPSDPEVQVYAASVKGIPRVSPRAVSGQGLDFELDLDSGELGILVVGFGLTSGTPVTLPGIQGQFDLDVSAGLHTVLTAVGPGTKSNQVTLPTSPSLTGQVLYFQGIRLSGTRSGAFTRWGYFQVF